MKERTCAAGAGGSVPVRAQPVAQREEPAQQPD